MYKGIRGKTLLVSSVALMLTMIAAQGQESKDEFHAGSRALIEYIPGVDYAPGEVLLTIPQSVEPKDSKELAADIRLKLERGALDREINEVTVTTLRSVKSSKNPARICGQRLVTVRFDPKRSLDEAFLRAVREALKNAYGATWTQIEGSFTEAPNDFAGKPSDEPNPMPNLAGAFEQARVQPDDAEDVLVAVIDSGSSLKVPGVNYVNPGWEFHRDGSEGPDGFTDNYLYVGSTGSELRGHGSQAAGIISGRPTEPGTGLARGAQIMPIQACDERRVCSALQVVQALCYAASAENRQERPADVINLSLGGLVGGKAIENAVLDARDANAVIVMSAGNSRNPKWGIPGNPPSTDRVVLESRKRFINDPVYPAAFSTGFGQDPDGLISVGSVNSAPDPDMRELSRFSTFNDRLDFVVRGEGLKLYWPDGRIHSGHSGTSFAAPFVAAMAAVLKHTQLNRTPQEIEARLRDDSTPGLALALTCGTTCGVLNNGYTLSLKQLLP